MFERLSPALDRTAHAARTTTALLTVSIIETLESHDWQCRPEFPIDAPSRGYLDVLATHPDGVTLAIEIDRAHKPWSVEKMLAAGDRYGAMPVWVRWRERLSLRVPDSLCVYDLTRGGLRVLNDPAERPMRHVDG